jgi:hypothetical protein
MIVSRDRPACSGYPRNTPRCLSRTDFVICPVWSLSFRWLHRYYSLILADIFCVSL